MSIFSDLWRSKGGKIYILLLMLFCVASFALGYVFAKNETPPIIIEKMQQ